MSEKIEVPTVAELRYQMRCRLSDMEAEVESIRSQLAAANEAKAKAERERDKLMAWAILHFDDVCLRQTDDGKWQALNEDGDYVTADTPEAAIHKAAGLEQETP